MENNKIFNIDTNMNELRKDVLERIYLDRSVESAILSISDLEIYSKYDNFFTKFSRAIKKSVLNGNIILTNEQEKCLEILSKGNLFISAPTSFGKTYIGLEYISRNKNDLNTIIFVVPTIALMNEVRKKCFKHFGNFFTLVTSDAELKQNYYETKKIIIVVPERISTKLFKQYLEENRLDFLIYDEIYKLNFIKSKKTDEDSRLIIMNYIYKYLVDKAHKVLLLGPFIKDVTFERSKLKITKFITNLNLVYNKVIFDPNFSNYYGSLNEKRFIYFDSPKNITKFLNDNNFEMETVDCDLNVLDWMSENIHPDWYYINYLRNGIGIHHGKTPIFLRKYIESEYANGCIHTILCTSTLIEGINTPTNSLFVHDKPRGVFELNNLIGRVGRLNVENPRQGSIFIKDSEIMALYNPNEWIELNILFEDPNVDSDNKEDECIYLDKEPCEEINQKIDLLKGILFEKFNISYYEVIDAGIEYKILDRFVSNFEKITSHKKEFNVISDIKFILVREYNKYMNGLKLSNYSFFDSDTDSEKYLNFDPVYLLLISTRGMRNVIDKFTLEYSSFSIKDINYFIDTLFQIDEFIKFNLSKIVAIFDLFNSKHIFDSKKNRAFIQSINMIKSYGNLKDGYERILEDLGFPKQDTTLIINEISKYTDVLGTENKLKKIENYDVFDNLSPFGKKIIKDIK